MSTGVERDGLVPTLIVPDEQTWTMLGSDAARFGAEPSFRAAATVAVLRPSCVPDQLEAHLAACIEELPDGARIEIVDLPMPCGERVTSRPKPSGARGRDHEAETGHGHEHGGDMMAIVGEPSADGLVMEQLELRYGPLGVPTPGGITIEATLDGDVVVEASVAGLEVAGTAGLRDSPPQVPDPLSPTAWSATIASSAGVGGPSAAGLELERAISHLAWLRSLSRQLGWTRLTNLTVAAIAELSAIDPAAPDRLEAPGGLAAAAAATAGVRALLERSRTFRWRLAGRGVVTADRAESLGLTGPNARASGIARDGRLDDPRYGALGFGPLTETGGDAASRTLLRAREAEQSVELASSALAAGSLEAEVSDGSGTVEGSRGPLRARHDSDGWSLAAPGATAARALAGELMVGERWEDALVVLASFDLSPWEVGR